MDGGRIYVGMICAGREGESGGSLVEGSNAK
jgi:hypothetical protein